MDGRLIIGVMAAFVVGTTILAYAITMNLPPILPAGQRSVSPDGAAFEVQGAVHRVGDLLTFTIRNEGNNTLQAPCGLVIERLGGRTWDLVAPPPKCSGERPRLGTGETMQFSWRASTNEPFDGLAAVEPDDYRAIAKVTQLDFTWSLAVGFTLE